MELRIPPPIQTLFFAFLMWIFDRKVDINIVESNVAKYSLITIFLVLAAIVMGAALIGFNRRGTTVNPLDPSKASSIVTSGIYSYTRNPMYLGMSFILVAWGVWLQNPVNVALLVLFLIYITKFQIIPEEKALTQKFGHSFIKYSKDVRRWI